MFELDTKITLNKDTVDAVNLCDRFTPEELDKIGDYVVEGFKRDKQSRHKWERRTQSAMDLAMQVQKDKSFPWPNASNIAFPLVTIAMLQFHSRAYPALIAGPDVAKCRVVGQDPTGMETARAGRISTHMSWQCMEQDKGWEEGKDRLLINLPAVGCTFTKQFWDPDLGYRVTETVLAQDFVVDYWTKSLGTCPRMTHIIPFFRNDIHARVKREVFRDVLGESWYQGLPQQMATEMQDQKRDNRLGLTQPAADESTPFMCLEQHLNLDLDGDGYAEPYIITVEFSSCKVLRIVCGFDQLEDIEQTKDGDVISIRRTNYFTKYEFIPSPDGGFYGIGFGVLLGPLNEATNSLINQLVDAGTMSNSAGGFLGRGAKIRGGTYTFAPLEWKRVDSDGDDLRKNIVPLEVREPSNVLFQLLSLLINYVNRIAGTTDPMVGENPGQNTPAENMRTMVQEGSRVYSAVFKRVWRAMKEEFKIAYILNGLFLPIRYTFGDSKIALREDYLGNPDRIAPAADPNVVSDQMQLNLATQVKAAAMQTPGYNPEEVERYWLRALKVPNIDQIYPGVSKTGSPESEKIQIQKLKNEIAGRELEAEQLRFMAQLQEQVRVDTAEIMKIAAEIENMKATTEGDKADRQVAMMQSILKAMEGRNKEALSKLDVLKKAMEVKRAQIESGNGGDVAGLAGASGDAGAAAGAGGETAAA